MPAATEHMPILHPAVLWAQKHDKVFVTVNIEDCKNPQIDLTSKEIHFKGNGGSENKPYAFDIELFHEIDTEKSKYVHRPRNIEFTLIKKEIEPWKFLTTDKKQPAFIKTDFSKYQDEDESDDEKMGGGFGGMGGMPGMGMPGMGGGNFDLNSMMSQMGGMGGMNGANFDDLDDDLPEDEEEESEESDHEGAQKNGKENAANIDDDLPDLIDETTGKTVHSHSPLPSNKPKESGDSSVA